MCRALPTFVRLVVPPPPRGVGGLQAIADDRPVAALRRRLHGLSRCGRDANRLDDPVLAQAFRLIGLDPAQRFKQDVGVLAQQGRTADGDG